MRPHDLVDHFADALVVVGADGRVEHWNRGAAEVFGWSADEAVGRLLVDLVVPEAQQADEARRLAAVEADGATFEAVRRRRDGALLHADVSMRAVRREDGALEAVAVGMKDVTHLKSLREAEVVRARFGDLLDATPDAMLLVNAAGRIVLANGEAERLFGWPRRELVGQPVEGLVPERFRHGHPGHRTSYASAPVTRPMGQGRDLYALRRDGTEFPAEISLAPVPGEDGTLTSVAVRDVAVRRGVEAKFRGLLEAAPDAIVIVDPDGRIVLVNAQAERLFGWPRAELLEQPVEVLIPARERVNHAGHRSGYARRPRTREMGSGLQLKAIRRDGTMFPVEVSLSPLDTESGTLVSAAIRDVSDRRRTEEELRLAVQELEAFSYSVAHDLRAPLRGMNGFAQILLDEYRDRLDADGLDCLHEIRNNAVRMDALVEALLSLSRVGRSDLHLDDLDLVPLVRAVHARCHAEAPDRAVDLVVPDALPVRADARLARTLVENLVGNAWKFTSGVEAARIEVGLDEDDDGRAFFVRDNGAGFDPAYAGRLFAPFQRLHAESEFPGTGIGLATAHRIVRRHGGSIRAAGAVGEGATFRFTFGDGGWR